MSQHTEHREQRENRCEKRRTLRKNAGNGSGHFPATKPQGTLDAGEPQGTLDAGEPQGTVDAGEPQGTRSSGKRRERMSPTEKRQERMNQTGSGGDGGGRRGYDNFSTSDREMWRRAQPNMLRRMPK